MRPALASAASGALLALGMPACSSPDVDGVIFSCETSSDCLAGRVCGELDGVRACVPADQSPITIGMTGPFRGPSGALGVELRRGVLAEFERVNAEGGVSGRRLELDSKNDDYDPELARENVETLLDIRELAPRPGMPDVRGPNSVFALLGSIGTETTLATAPLANRNGVVLFSPFTGAHDYLRDGTRAPYIYNFRPGYFDETEVLVDYMANQRQPRIISNPPGDSYRRLLVFAQNDAYGDAGYAGLVEAYNRRAPLPQPDAAQPNPSIARIGYDRDDMASVEPAIEQATLFLGALLDAPASAAGASAAGASAGPASTAPVSTGPSAPGITSGISGDTVSVGVVMIDTYQPANRFIRAVKDWINADPARARRLDVLFSHVSFVGADALAGLLSSPPADYLDVLEPSRRKSYAEGVLVTAVVPSYESEALGIASYRRDIDRFDGGNYGFTSLEGYLTARLFTQALGLCPDLSTESLRQTLDTQLTDVDLGIGVKVGFSSIDHEASHTVWGSVLRGGGRIDVPFVWTPETGIRPN